MSTEMFNRELNRGLGWLVALGVLMILLGIAAIAEPLIATIVVARVLSWTLLLLVLSEWFMPFSPDNNEAFG